MTTNVKLIVNCPKCNDPIIIEQINCSIFRHAIYKNTYQQINSHSTKEKIDNLIISGLVYGCGTPFKIILHDGKYDAIICDYI